MTSLDHWGLIEPQRRALHSTPETQSCLPSPSLCLKSQLVDLKAKGYWEDLLDRIRPDIVVKDW